MDTNKNGSIKWTEFIEFCKKATPDMTEAEMKADWDELDLNAVAKVTLDELLKFLKKKLQVKEK